MFVSLNLATKLGEKTYLQPGDVIFFSKYELGTGITVARQDINLLIGYREPTDIRVFLYGVDVAAACLITDSILRATGIETIMSLHPKYRVEIFSTPPPLTP